MHTAKSVAIGVAALTVVATLTSPDHMLVLCVGVTLAVGIWLLWPEKDAPILLLPFGLQWISVAVKPIQTALMGQPLQNFSDFNEPLDPGAWLGIASVAALGFGMWIGKGFSRTDWAKTLARDSDQWPAALVIPVSLALIVIGGLLTVLSNHAGGARQILIAFGGAQNAGMFILAYWCLKEGKALPLLGAVVAVEVVVGMTGFFAGFRQTLLVLLLAAAASRPRLSLTSLLAISAALGLMLVVVVFWTAIKVDYREFQNGGSEQQIVVRPMAESLGYLGQAADEFNGNQFQRGLRELASRVSYIDFLAGAINHVPEVVPHQDGALLGQAVLNMVEPRLLFPDKPPTPDDSVVTAHYTGFALDLSTDTSISIGYIGELYIDFGYVGAVIGAFLIGLFAGWGYRFIRGFRGIPLFFTYGIAAYAMLLFSIFETDLVRFLGSAITAFLACLVLQRMIAPQVLTALTVREARIRAA